MVVRIRLARHGFRNRPFYHIVAANGRTSLRSQPLETLGTFDPIPKKVNITDKIPRIKDIELNVPRFKHWISVGAQPTYAVTKLMEKFDLLPAAPKVLPVVKKERSS
ncbi:mitochondrial 37S ribosomal protein MRPS16 [Schizosaccharomyces japonicus yFS275]|uniref:Ribosomal protein subunit S16 n=1 Tax=Schizosaccharomyces japonicus (strain yFS275 / FY16936) TaxID=402676 RepID=B6K259_SCHJY|nr:mitochondrial 37S ribosomal protein MRPS16 [Schizosaccharomyces japonicus yFS275]EEB07240.1 ribosomal protein subunit S16 [Schizosaccharomyces japonicus yFS275]